MLLATPLITHAGMCRRRGVGHSVASVCVFVRALKGKRLELSAPKSVDIIVHGRTSAFTDPEVKRLNLNVNPWVSVLTFAMGMGRDSPGVGLHVDTTAHFSSSSVHPDENPTPIY